MTAPVNPSWVYTEPDLVVECLDCGHSYEQHMWTATEDDIVDDHQRQDTIKYCMFCSCKDYWYSADVAMEREMERRYNER